MSGSRCQCSMSVVFLCTWRGLFPLPCVPLLSNWHDFVCHMLFVFVSTWCWMLFYSPCALVKSCVVLFVHLACDLCLLVMCSFCHVCEHKACHVCLCNVLSCLMSWPHPICNSFLVNLLELSFLVTCLVFFQSKGVFCCCFFSYLKYYFFQPCKTDEILLPLSFLLNLDACCSKLPHWLLMVY